VGTPWDAETYDRTSKPQQRWANEVLSRLIGVDRDATVLDVGCGTGRVTEHLARLVPGGRVLAIDASEDMVALASERLGERAEVSRCDVLELDLEAEVDVVFSTATLHWVTDHDALWPVLARALKPGGRLEAQCGGEGNIEQVRAVIDEAAAAAGASLDGFSPWTFASPEDTERRLEGAGFAEIKCWLADEPAFPEEMEAFVRTSILGAHLEHLPEEQHDPFVAAVMERVRLPLDYVRLNVSAVRDGAAERAAS
jgi:trans-aconitate 2-methyltransferase